MKELFIYGIIGQTEEDEAFVSAEWVIRELSWLDNDVTEIKVRINSPGGSVFEGNAIFDALNKCGKKVIVQIDGLAASMASIIAMVGQEIIMTPFAQIMTHKPCGRASGNAQAMRQQADLLDEMESKMLAVYVARTGLTEEECKVKFLSDTNTWFNAQQAVEAGLADRIEEGRLKINAAPPVSDDVEGIYKHFAAKLNTKSMDFLEQLRKNLNLSAELTEDSIFAHLSDLQARASQVEGLTTQVTDLTARVQGFEAAEIAARELEVSNLIDTAIAERRILPTAKADWTALFNASPEAAKAQLMAIAKVVDLSSVPGADGGTMDRKDWDFKRWSKEDPKGLVTMKSERHEEYVALYKATYKVEPKQ